MPIVTYAQGGNLLEVFLWKLVNGVFGWMVWLSGMLLDYAINSMVVGFGQMYATSGLGLTIDTLWVTVRDIFNLTFIFGLVFIGLRMIFGSDSNTKKVLVSIILAALLVNFSLFITKFVVDFSNIAAVQLVNAFPKDASGVPSISGQFTHLMGLTSLWNFSSQAGVDFSNMTGGGSTGYIFGTMFLYIITAFVFFAGALLLIIRFVVLNIYMVLSPFMFIGWVFPSMEKYSKEYWSGFLSRCFVAPAYLLMLYFSSKVLVSFSVTGGGGANSLSTMFTKAAPASFAAVFPPFILTAVFLIAAVVVAQKMSATGGSAVISFQDKMMKKTRSAVQGTAFAMTRPARSLGRMGVNQFGSGATKSFNKWQANAQIRAAAPGAGAISKAAAWAYKANGTDSTVRAITGSLKDAQFGTGTTNEKGKEYAQKVQSNINQNQAEYARAQIFAASQAALDPANPILSSTAQLTTALDDLGKTLKTMTKDEKIDLGIKELTNVHVASNLTEDDIDNFEKSGKFSAKQVQNMKDARKAGLTSIAAGGSTFATVDPATGNVTGFAHPNAGAIGLGGAPVPTIPDRRSTISGQGSQAVGKMPVSVFTQPTMYEYGHLTPSMVEERIKKGITPAEKTLIRTALETAMGGVTLPSLLPAPALAASPWMKQWVKWENSNSFHAANFFT